MQVIVVVVVFATSLSLVLRSASADTGSAVAREGSVIATVEANAATIGTDGATRTCISLGLLRGVDPTVDDFYANEIDMSEEGLAWLDEPGRLWEAAKKDAGEMGLSVEEYIEKVEANVESFRISGIIHDREELLHFLDQAVRSKGAFTLLLGGKNVGKSTVLKRLAAESNNRTSKLFVLYVDARYSPGRLDVGLANAIVQLATAQIMRKPEMIDWVELFKRVIRLGFDRAVTYALSKIKVDSKNVGKKNDLREILEVIANSVFYPASDKSGEVSYALLDKFIKFATDQHSHPVLVIDEANVVLGIKSGGITDDQTRNLLTKLVSYTKQDFKLNVIMASSEYSYPYRLKREGFDLRNLDNTIFAGEIPPKEMWKLLVSATYKEGNRKGDVVIGMGPHLAELCLAAYGGHFWNVRRAILGLSAKREHAEASSYLPDMGPEIKRCLNTNSKSHPILIEMAKGGFAPIESPDDEAAELISKQDVGGVITRKAVCIGISHAKWNSTREKVALIPSSQSVRLEIAQVLLNRPLLSEICENRSSVEVSQESQE